MYILLSQEEEAELKNIRNKYNAEKESISDKIQKFKAGGDPEEVSRLYLKKQVIMESIQAEIDGFLDQAQRKRFKLIEEDGAQAIINNAKDQITPLLEDIKRITEEEYYGIDNKTLKSMEVGTRRKDGILLNANFAVDAIKRELYLHIEALRENKNALKDLLEIIIRSVKESNLTGNEEIKVKDAETPVHFRRAPLTPITKYGLMNDLSVANFLQEADALFTDKMDGQITMKWAVNQSGKKKNPVSVYFAMKYEGEEYRFTKKLTAFDKEVLNALGTRFFYENETTQQGNFAISPYEIWRTMNGKRGKENPSKKQIERICKSIDKMRFTRFYGDISNEINVFGLEINDERIVKGVIDTYLLKADKVTLISEKGVTMVGYRINEEPIIYTYNRAKGHILKVPYEMLDTVQYITDGENVAEFKGYLLQQIQLMKNAASEEGKGKYFKRSNTILIETIYNATGTQTPEERAEEKAFTSEAAKNTYIRKTRAADRKKIEALLEAWTDKKWIKEYKAINAKGQPVNGKQVVKGYNIII